MNVNYQTMKEFINYLRKKTFKLMKIFAHFKTIKDDPGKFVLWLLSSVVLALSTVWLPFLLGALIGQNYFFKLMENNPFIIYSVVFLSNSILTAINYKGAGSNNFAVAIRGITIVFTILYLVFLSSIVPLKIVSNISLNITTQFVLLVLTVLVGIYIYGFREASWEASVDEFRREQDNAVNNIVGHAHDISIVGGIAL